MAERDALLIMLAIELPLYLSRADLLRKARGTGPKFISAEPLLADVGSALNLSGISQVIAGGESGLHLRDPARAPPRHGRPAAQQTQCN